MGIVKKDLEKLSIEEQRLENAYNKAMETPTPATARSPEELQRAEEVFDPMAAPSGLFGLYLPHFIDLVNSMSSKSLKRLVRSLIAYPLEDLTPNKNNEEEVTAYKIGQKLLEAKYLMVLYTAMLAEEQERLKRLAQDAEKNSEPQSSEEPKEQVVLSETNSEVTNER